MKFMILFVVALLVVNTRGSNIPSEYYQDEEQVPERVSSIEENNEDDETQNDAFEFYEPVDEGNAAEKDDVAATLNEINDQARAADIDEFELTAFRQPFTYTCPPGSAMSYMYSVHQNSLEDRRWRFGCRKISNSYIKQACTWSRNHGFDQPLQGMCAAGYVVTGFRSLQYSPHHKDRHFNVRCCRTNQVESCCTTTNYINNWDAVLTYTAPANKVITGIYSVHDNYREDRRFKVKVCGVKKAFYDCTC